jgi:hypothetical protein
MKYVLFLWVSVCGAEDGNQGLVQTLLQSSVLYMVLLGFLKIIWPFQIPHADCPCSKAKQPSSSISVNPLNTHVHLQDKAKHHFLSTEIPAVPG